MLGRRRSAAQAMTEVVDARVDGDDVLLELRYRLDLGDSAWGAVYLQGVNEQTHGIADSLISVLAHRSQDIVDDLLDLLDLLNLLDRRDLAEAKTAG